IFNEHLPWLKYNKPNLSASEKDRINKRSTGGSCSGQNTNSSNGSNHAMNTSMISNSTGHN
ncbi:unnamed protein product, partial [Schistosoma turkestanicum]